MVPGIDAEDVAALCLLEADGELEIPASDLADLIDATERRAGATFGPSPGAMRLAIAGLILEAALARPGELAEGGIDAALDRVTLGDLLGPMLSRDRLIYTSSGVHWLPLSPAAMAVPGTRRRAGVLLAVAASRPPPSMVLAVLEQAGIDRSFIRILLDQDREPDEDDLHTEAAYQDWFE